MKFLTKIKKITNQGKFYKVDLYLNLILHKLLVMCLPPFPLGHNGHKNDFRSTIKPRAKCTLDGKDISVESHRNAKLDEENRTVSLTVIQLDSKAAYKTYRVS